MDQRFDPIVPLKLAAIYVTDAIQGIDCLDLRATRPAPTWSFPPLLDPVVFDRVVERDGLRCVAPSQLAADLLSRPARKPSRGEQMTRRPFPPSSSVRAPTS